MKKFITSLFLGFFALGMVFSNAFSSDEAQKLPSFEERAKEMAKDYPLKSYHQRVQLDCKHCHGDGDPEEYEELEDETCLSCHKSKDDLANRLQFMDKDKTNPHNSVHDGTNLSCYECHSSHQPSVNMCADCHNIKTWMKEIE